MECERLTTEHQERLRLSNPANAGSASRGNAHGRSRCEWLRHRVRVNRFQEAPLMRLRLQTALSDEVCLDGGYRRIGHPKFRWALVGALSVCALTAPAAFAAGPTPPTPQPRPNSGPPAWVATPFAPLGAQSVASASAPMTDQCQITPALNSAIKAHPPATAAAVRALCSQLGKPLSTGVRASLRNRHYHGARLPAIFHTDTRRFAATPDVPTSGSSTMPTGTGRRSIRQTRA